MKKAALIILFTIFVFSLAFGGVGFTDLQIRLMPPSSEHPFGTDMLGRDILSRCALGTLISILIASSVTAISLAFGILLSFLYLHPSFHEGIILSVSDSLKSIPSIVLALFISAIAGPGIAVLPRFGYLTEQPLGQVTGVFFTAQSAAQKNEFVPAHSAHKII